MAKHELAGLRVLVTRPEHQAGTLEAMLQSHGADTTCFPVIAIKAITPSAETLRLLTQLDSIDFAVFISPNAVSHGLLQLQECLALDKDSFTKKLTSDGQKKRLKLVTIGQASALKIQQILGKMPDIYPEKQ